MANDYGLSKDGFKPKRLDVILEEINNSTRAIFGDNINLAPESPDGQFNGSIAEPISDTWQLGNAVNDNFDPEAAQGVGLSRLILLNGLKRKPATKSTVTATFTGSQGTTIPKGFEVQVQNDGAVFVTKEEKTIPAGGSVDIDMESKELGSKQANAGELTEIVTPINGLSSVTNSSAAILGENEETDKELRVRRAFSTEFPSTNIIDSLYSKLLALSNVKSLYVYENETSSTDSRGLPPHSFNVVILGGDNTEIAKTIWTTKPSGILSHGATSEQITDSQGLPRTIRFDRPTEVPIYVVINTNELSGFPSDGEEQIKNNLVNFATENFLISDDVIRTRLYSPINEVPGHSVQKLFIGKAPNPNTEADIEIGFNEIAQFTKTNITVNVS